MKDCLFKIHDFGGDAFNIFNLFKDEPHVFFLDSRRYDAFQGRYSFIGFDPFEVVRSRGKDTLPELRKKFNDLGLSPSIDGPTPLAGGIVGFLGYDFGMSLETIKTLPKEECLLPDCCFGFYDTVITIDHQLSKMIISSTGLPEPAGHLREQRALKRLGVIEEKLAQYKNEKRQNSDEDVEENTGQDLTGQYQCNFTHQEYCHAVRKAQDYIRAGDIYQVNLSQRFVLDDPAVQEMIRSQSLLRTLRDYHYVTHGAYFQGGDFQIISNSPEQFLRLRGGVVTTRPMKGTRARGKTPLEDRRLREELINSDKDRAELLMVTDLLRNDLGRVCSHGSVKVKTLRQVEEYKTVFQTTSLVEGVLEEGRDCFDLLRACFPGGSITGCPKIRAMEIIEELEPSQRGPYTGALGYISFSGDMDFNILIRTLVVQQNKISFQVGGGIVADSVPEKEYEETLVKARALSLCLNQVLRVASRQPHFV